MAVSNWHGPKTEGKNIVSLARNAHASILIPRGRINQHRPRPPCRDSEACKFRSQLQKIPERSFGAEIRRRPDPAKPSSATNCQLSTPEITWHGRREKHQNRNTLFSNIVAPATFQFGTAWAAKPKLFCIVAPFHIFCDLRDIRAGTGDLDKWRFWLAQWSCPMNAPESGAGAAFHRSESQPGPESSSPENGEL